MFSTTLGQVKVVLPLKTTLQASRFLAALVAVFALWNLFCFADILLRVNGDGDHSEMAAPGKLAAERRQLAIRWGVSLLLATGCIGALVLSDRKRNSNRRSSWAQAAVESASDAIFVTDRDLGILEWNSAVERLLGYPRDEIRGQGLECILPITPDMRTAALRVPDSETRMKARVMRRDGSRLAMEITLRQQWLGDRAGFVCYARVAAAPSVVDPAYREEVRFLTEIFDAAPSPMVVMDPQGRIERMNSAAQNMLGRTAVELRSCRYWEVFLSRQEQVDRARAEYDDLSAGKLDAADLEPVEEEWITAGGEVRPIRWSRSAVRTGDGDIHHIVLVSGGTAAAHHAPITIEIDTTAAVSERNT